jgi:hypothetical protein
MCSDGQHRRFGLVNVRRVRLPLHPVEIEEHHERSPRRALVAISERMVSRQPTHQHRGFLEGVDVELVTAELSRRRM